ncbi:MAG: hypothetical protein H6702_07715, partial [Myxococcales bacterium]|nr:hypothetical protein [Myxococcales bacterium]
LARAEQFAAERPLTPAETDFVAAARAWELRKSQEEDERARRKRLVMGGGMVLAGLVVGMSIFGMLKQGEAERSAATAATITDSVRLAEGPDDEAALHRAQSKYAAAAAEGDVVAQAHYGAALVKLNLDEGAVAEAARVADEVAAKLPALAAQDANAAALAQERLEKARARLVDAEWFKGLTGALAKADFVILLDVDALLDRQYDPTLSARCPAEVTDERGQVIRVPRAQITADGAPRTVVVRPDWKLLCQRIYGGDGKLVLVVDRRDAAAEALVAALEFSDRPLTQEPFFAGTIGRGEVSWLVDEPALMKKTVLVARDVAFPPRNTRPIDGFEADRICGGVPVRDPGRQMRLLAQQIDEALAAKGDFAAAFLPYTAYGWPRLIELKEQRGISADEARALLRRYGSAEPPEERAPQKDGDAVESPSPPPEVHDPTPQRPRPKPFGYRRAPR